MIAGWNSDSLFSSIQKERHATDALRVGSQVVPVRYVRNYRARRYIIRLQPDGSVRTTVPRAGSIKEARAFTERNFEWIARQIQNLQQRPVAPRAWQHGTEILYRGQPVALRVAPNHTGYNVTFADQSVRVTNTAEVRPFVERHLWKLAARELSQRATELATRHSIAIQRITVRNQRSRWGSCSHQGTISLNWRLIQTPDFVRDYIILHELMHRREMNHSKKYWQQVAAVCPEFEKAETWLKQHRHLLR